jgi:MSHA biogenesis protein MshI
MFRVEEKTVLSFSRRARKIKSGWVAVAPDGDRVHLAHVVRQRSGSPCVRWVCTEDWADATRSLHALRRTRRLAGQRTVAVLARSQYQLIAMDAPELPRDEWRDGLRWQLKDMVEFAVDTAGIEVIEIPRDPRQHRKSSVFALAASRDTLVKLSDAGADAGVPWHAIDIAETALRNIALLCVEGQRGEALLHVGPDHSTLVIVAQGELLATRRIEVSYGQLTDDDDDARQQVYERASLELQRTLDNVERQFSHANLARLQVAPGRPLTSFVEFVRDLIYVPVRAFDLNTVVDLSAVPALADARTQATYLTAIGAALRWLR